MYFAEAALEGVLESDSVAVEYISTASYFFQKYDCQIGESMDVLLPDVYNGIALQKSEKRRPKP